MADDQKLGWNERARAADAARAEGQWGMYLVPDERSPVRLAWEAYQRGDRYFQIDLPVNYVQGNMGSTMLWAQSRVVRPEVPADFIGQIEDQGWEFLQVSTSYLMQGQITAGNLQTAYHGTTIALYMFRRRAGAAPD